MSVFAKKPPPVRPSRGLLGQELGSALVEMACDPPTPRERVGDSPWVPSRHQVRSATTPIVVVAHYWALLVGALGPFSTARQEPSCGYLWYVHPFAVCYAFGFH